MTTMRVTIVTCGLCDRAFTGATLAQAEGLLKKHNRYKHRPPGAPPTPPPKDERQLDLEDVLKREGE